MNTKRNGKEKTDGKLKGESCGMKKRNNDKVMQRKGKKRK